MPAPQRLYMCRGDSWPCLDSEWTPCPAGDGCMRLMGRGHRLVKPVLPSQKAAVHSDPHAVQGQVRASHPQRDSSVAGCSVIPRASDHRGLPGSSASAVLLQVLREKQESTEISC